MFLAPLLRNGPALRLLQNYTRALARETDTTPALQQTAASHLYDLASLALGATPDAAVLAKGRGVRAARLRAIKEDILANLTRPGLSSEAIARRAGISESYLRQLFADEGTSFTDFVLQQRLVLAHRMLVGARRSGRPINEIAFDCGFSDLSYFNRTFRRRYGATPSDVRADAPSGEML